MDTFTSPENRNWQKTVKRVKQKEKNDKKNNLNAIQCITNTQ